MLPKPLLDHLSRAGKPLVELTICPAPGEDLAQLIADLHALAPDFEAEEGVYNPAIRSGEATGPLYISAHGTREALARLFGWRLERANLPRWNPATQQHDGVWPDTYYWVEASPRGHWPAGFEHRLLSAGLSQPGSGDPGGPDTPDYDLSAWGAAV